MIKLLSLITLSALTLSVSGQAPSILPTTQPFGKIDKADLEMTACDFEKDANAEVLFDKGSVYFSDQYELIFERHLRTKIFNDKGNGEANVRIEFYGGNQLEYVTNLEAETINLNNGKVEITKVDKKSIFKQNVDKIRTAITFSFPNVKPGSVVEFRYALTTQAIGNFPDWFFQADIPTRYSELKTLIPPILFYKQLASINHPLLNSNPKLMAMANIPSFRAEPFMTSRKDNLDQVSFQLSSASIDGISHSFSDTWRKVAANEIGADDFGGQFKRKCEGEEAIINKAKTLKTDDDKIAYIFNEVKNNMKWNDEDERYTNDGTKEAWSKKTGNSTEINLILFHLLKKAGLKAYPLLVSTKQHGKVNPTFTSAYQFNKTVAYIPVDSNKYYALDATSKYNLYNETPDALLNRFGLSIDEENKNYDLVLLQKTTPVRQLTLINGEIKPGGKLSGTVQLNSFDYYKIDAIKKYKTDGEKKYIDYLQNGDNNLKISGVKFENMEVDTLPLIQNIDFKMDLVGSDDTYIYFNPNLFMSQHDNPFLNEQRYTDIDFGYRANISSNGTYREPAGYKIDALPKNISMTTPDKSISFKRLVDEQDGMILIAYLVDYKKSIYFKEDYPDLHEFFKKMNEMMNEQVVFKKQ